MSFKAIRNIIVVAGVILGTGYLRMPVEQEFTEDLRERKAIPPPIRKEVWGQMGQTSLAGVLGGLRTFIASSMNLGSQKFFEDKDWFELQKRYRIITALDPYNEFYWDHGAWHLAYNAASWARTNEDLTPRKRRLLEREFLEAGDAFYRQGLELNPEKYRLWVAIGNLWSNRYKRPDLNRAAEAYKMAAQSGNLQYKRSYLFAFARIPGREIEAFDYAQELLIENPSQNLSRPTFRCLLFCLSTNPDLPEDALDVKLGEIFFSKEQAYQDLYNYRAFAKKEGYYTGKLDEVLKSLIEELNIPDQLNPFMSGAKPRIFKRDWQKALDQPRPIRPPSPEQ